jgi:WD40 repeat protein
MRVWDLTTGALLHTMPEVPEEDICGLHFSPRDTRLLASAGSGGRIHLWDIDTGERIRSFEGWGFAVYSPDGRTIATAGPGENDPGLRLVDAESGEERVSMVGHEAYVESACFSLDGGGKLVSSSRHVCKVWDSSTGALLRTVEAGSAVVWGRDWVRDTKGEAFAMGHHPRLGAGSFVLELELGVVQMILDRV